MRLPKWSIILAVIALIGAGAIVVRARARRASPAVDAVTVERRDLVREVQVTGRVKAVAEVSLGFDIPGRIARAPVTVGAAMAAGAELATLDDRDLRAELARARAVLLTEEANLAALRFGTRPEELRIVETDVENAQRALASAAATLTNVEAKAIVDLANLYDDVPSTLRDAYTKADDAVRKQTDDHFTNDASSPNLTFRTAEYQAGIDAEIGRRTAERTLTVWASALDVLPEDDAGRDAAMTDVRRRLGTIRAFLDQLSVALNGVIDLSTTTAATYRASVHTARTNVGTATESVEALAQAIATQVATNRSARTTAEADVTAKRNALATAQARLALSRAGATSEELRAQEARVAAAAASVQGVETKVTKASIRAPFAGVVTRQDAKVGSVAVVGAPLVTLMSAQQFTVEANVPEVDLAGLAIGQRATVAFDAFGSQERLIATIAAIDPAATIIDGVPTYRTTLAFPDPDARIRAGLTADVTVAVAERTGVLAIPQRALVVRDGRTSVRVLTDGTITEVSVATGLRSSDGYVEITRGLTEGQTIVRSQRE